MRSLGTVRPQDVVEALESVEVAVVVVCGGDVACNRRADELFGDRLGEVLRRLDGVGVRKDVECLCADGSRRVFDVHGGRTGEGRGATEVWMFHDVTEDRRVATRLLHSTRLADVGQLAAGIAHEFNNILAVIEGLAQIHEGVLRRRPVVDTETVDILERIINQAERAAKIVRQIQDFAAPPEGKRAPCRLDEVVQAVVKLAEHQAELEGIGFRLDLEEGVVVHCDQGQLEQVLMNLVQNARYALLPKSGGTITVRLRRVGGEWAEVRVEDDGVGMAPETAARVFEPFFTTRYRPREGSPSVRGSGLGLAVSRSIVERHGGRIELVRTAPGAGAEFRILLPLHRVPFEDVPRGGEPPAEERPLPGRVLVVEAERELAASIGRVLKERGVGVVDICHTAAEALDAVRTRLYDVVLLDLFLPDAGGKGLVESLKRTDPQLRIVGMTGRVDADGEGWKRWGLDAVLRKPFRMDEMARVLAG